MADEAVMLARLREALSGLPGVVERRMMGGVCFMVEGHMLGGARVHKDGVARFMFRVGRENEPEALARPGARRVELGARDMPGFVHVDAEEVSAAMLRDWVDLALSYIATLPPKAPN